MITVPVPHVISTTVGMWTTKYSLCTINVMVTEAMPASFSAIQRYNPALEASTFVSRSEPVNSISMSGSSSGLRGTPSFSHVTSGSGTPADSQGKMTEEPLILVKEVWTLVMVGRTEVGE